jgi:hypothetical protein
VPNTPICGGSKQAKLFGRDVTWNKLIHGVTCARVRSPKLIQKLANIARTDKQIGMLNVIPEVLPDFLLRRAFLVHEIAAYLDV